eukprot:358486-Chlamydomonas_euryale.AAC.10
MNGTCLVLVHMRVVRRVSEAAGRAQFGGQLITCAAHELGDSNLCPEGKAPLQQPPEGNAFNNLLNEHDRCAKQVVRLRL